MSESIPPSASPPPPSDPEPSAFPGAERVLEAIMFTDIEKSVQLQQDLGTDRYAKIVTRHGELFYEALGSIRPGHVEKHTGDGFMTRFSQASEAVAAALRFQWLLRREPWDLPDRLRVRIGIHQGEILLLHPSRQMPGSIGAPVNLAARVMSMAEGGQILLTRAVFDAARQFIREIPDLPASADVVLGWEAHGAYVVRGLDNPVEIFEVGERGRARFNCPKSGDAAQRVVALDDEATLGWRPARAMEVPKRPGWILQRRIGEGGFGEVWMAENRRTHEPRVFKFCFDSVRLRSFKRELALFRLISETLGPRQDIATLYEVQLESPPFFLESEYCPGGTLQDWFERKEAAGGAPLSTRLDIIARVARALAAAHSVGVIHKDVKPSNIFIEERADGGARPLLADFGIGTVADADVGLQLDVSFTGELTTVGEPSHTGTRLYSAPEYMVGHAPSILGDVYSLGVVLYQIVIGDFRQPLGAGWHRHIADPLLAEDIADCVDVDPERRFSSALQLAERLENIEQRRAAKLAAEAEARQQVAQTRELEQHRRRVRIAWSSVVAASLLIGALSIVLFVEHRRRREMQSHVIEVEKEREVARERLYVADMQAVTEDLVQRRAENTRELIARHLPKPGEHDHRGWEWFFADSVLNTSHAAQAISPQPLRALAVSPDGRLVALGGDDGTITICATDTLEKRAAWAAGAPIHCLAWTDPDQLVAGLANGEVVLWNSAAGREQIRWKAHDGAVTAAGWHPVNPLFATGASDGSLAWWKPDGTLVESARRQGPIQAVAWHDASDQMAVTFGRPASLIIGTPETLGTAHESALEAPVSPVAWRPGTNQVALTLRDLPMLVRDPFTGHDLLHIPNSFNSSASTFAWSPGGDAIAVGCVDGKIILVNTNTVLESRTALYGHRHPVTAMRWLGSDPARLLSTGEDGYLRAWENLYRSPETGIVKFSTQIADARWHPTADQFAIVLGNDEVQVLDGTTLRPVWSRPLPVPLHARARADGARLAWSGDGRRLAAICPGRPPVAWDLESGKMKTFDGFDDATDAEWMSDGRRLLFRTSTGSSWASMDGPERARVAGSEGAAWVVALEDDRFGIVKKIDGALCFTATRAGETIVAPTPLPEGLAPIHAAALSRDRTQLALAGGNGMVMWLDTPTGEWRRPAIGHAGPVRSLAWHPAGTRLASLGTDGSCRIFNLAQTAQNWVLNPKLDAREGSLSWSADGSRLVVTSTPARTMKIFDAAASMTSHGLLARAPAPEAVRTAEILHAIARQPGEEFGWQEFAADLASRRDGESETDFALLRAAARLGTQARFDPLDDETPKATAICKTWRGAELPLAVQVAQASALRQWATVLALCENQPADGFGAEWLALAQAEALEQTGRSAEAEQRNLAAWRALRRLHGVAENTVPPPPASAEDSRSADLRPWANFKITDDWNNSDNNNLAQLPALLPQRDGFSFHTGDFIQLAGKSLRISKARMLPRSTGWIPLPRPASAVSFALASCYIDSEEALQDMCIGSLYLLRRGQTRAARIPLIYGRNIWDWWTPPFGKVDEAPPALVAWHGDNPRARSEQHGIALYRIAWTDPAGEPPIVAISFVSNVRRPAPFLVAAEITKAAEK